MNLTTIDCSTSTSKIGTIKAACSAYALYLNTGKCAAASQRQDASSDNYKASVKLRQPYTSKPRGIGAALSIN
jgi:hypothetical protein